MRKPFVEAMSSSHFREVILSEHDMLRGLLARIIALGEAPATSAADVDRLRESARRLYKILAEHMSFEERMLPVALRDVIGWGPTLQARIAADHPRQRLELAVALEALDAGSPSWEKLVEDLRVFAATLLHDMQREEAGLFEADVDEASTDGQGG